MKIVFRAMLGAAIIFEGVLFLLMNVVSGLPGWVFLLPLAVVVAAFLLLFGGMWQDYLRNGRSGLLRCPRRQRNLAYLEKY